MDLVVPEIPAELASDLHGWLGTVTAGDHQFWMHACYDPDHYSDTRVRWIGVRDKSSRHWQVPSSLEGLDCWNPNSDPSIRWLIGGSTGRGWPNAFERATQDLVTKLKPELIHKVEFGWNDPPQRARKNTNGSQAS